MSLHFHWFLPTNGDGRDIGGVRPGTGRRRADSLRRPAGPGQGAW
jgi:hypothetical protein